ncbi:hypothetical protein [Prescottella agglutinans]|uniref:DUF2635 domain-containing protein n=1 Tax=Prescottella agglutinans TaxID=1644129 RepID=A0ABT6MGY6_9NOCA|nr:hypothetical protein [Prescottella agglutinans]MDH6283124.1 hypothetical protein [Prescottella agglutinans]
MSFTPIAMRSPEGREVRAGSAVEREQLISRGYRVVTAKPDTKPVEAPKTPAEPSKTTTPASK